MHVGLYARVSTHDQHTLPMQREAMQTYIASRGWTVVKNVEDVGSGVVERPQREALMPSGPPPRDRCHRGVAAGSVGSLLGRPRGDALRAE